MTTNETLPTKERILSVSVRLFLEQGYKKTRFSEITEQAGVSNSSFQHYFRAKDGILTELVRFMFRNQFDTARLTAGAELPPIYVYAVETAIQIALTELNENLREIYLEAYTHEEALHIIHRATAKELYRTFGRYQPMLTEEDFLVLEYGSAGLMRGYMAIPCTDEFPLEKKLEAFLSLALRGYCVPEDEVRRVLGYLSAIDVRAAAQRVMGELFQSLAMHFEFSLSGMMIPSAVTES